MEKELFKYLVLDVFTREKYKGNQLAVVFAEGELELSQYEDISREFGYSESSFIYYSAADKALKVRSFTSTGFEIHGAGHNLLGVVCAVLLKNIAVFDEQPGDKFVIMKDQKIELSIGLDEASQLPLVGMRQKSAVIGKTVPSDLLAEALSLAPDELLSGDFAPTVVGTEVTHLMVPLKSIEALNKATSNRSLLIKLAARYGFEGVYFFAFTENDPGHIVQTRFFNPGIGIDEDPATGSAAGPLAGYLYHKNRVAVDKDYQILQGVQMKQPSVIKFKVSDQGITVSGSSVITMEGVLYK